ncbi:SIS domain-containing protein [Collinsella intestinalis]|uniref:SIS domain-containing protein n=1 Tax=Collinsella intestinalis TaxID=147207 RepID=UPI0025A3DDA2|nr:SIS domain-containing protein [Collinsella intestinalis]MDM8163671.1 SIS domain-containing protein [Collinsella intestinalis]
MVEEKISLPKMDIEGYLADGAAVVAKTPEIEAIADKLHDRGYSNLIYLGMGGTYDELGPQVYFVDKYAPELDAFLVNAAEFDVLGNKHLNKDSIVIAASASGDTKEIVAAVKKMVDAGIEVVAFTKADTTLGKLATTVIPSPAITGRCDFSYYMFNILTLRLLNRRGDFPDYDAYVAQTKNIFNDLLEIRKSFDPRAEEIARAYAHEPYSIFVGSGALWGETVLFSMCILEEMQWVRTRAVSSPDFFHGTLELVEPGVPVFLFKGEDECRALDNRVEKFCREHTDKLVVIDTAEYAIDGLDPKFRVLVSPMILTALTTERLSRHYETYTRHNLQYRRYYRQFDY